MNIDIKRVFGILIFIQIFINGQILSLGDSSGEKRHNSLRRAECPVLCEKLNLNSKCFLSGLKKMITTAERTFKKLLVNQSSHTDNTLAKLIDKHSKMNSINLSQADSANLTAKNTIIRSTAFRDLVNNVNRVLRIFQKTCISRGKVSSEKKKIKTSKEPPVYCNKGKWEVGLSATAYTNIAALNTIKNLNILNEEPEYINITLREAIKASEVFILHASFANTTSKFECDKVLGQNVTIHVKPNVNYLICLASVDSLFRVNVFECQPYKTKPLRENEPWLVRKSIPILIISVFVLIVSGMAMGASILYLSLNKNPSLRVKRVVEVKRQDKAQNLIMPRGYESLPRADSPLALTNDAHEHAISCCDTNSTISYVSAIQPTPVEILTYRLSRLRELFNGNNFPLSVSSIPMSISMSLNQRLPPNVDLLLEYEWYTITTTIIMTIRPEQEEY